MRAALRSLRDSNPGTAMFHRTASMPKCVGYAESEVSEEDPDEEEAVDPVAPRPNNNSSNNNDDNNSSDDEAEHEHPAADGMDGLTNPEKPRTQPLLSNTERNIPPRPALEQYPLSASFGASSLPANPPLSDIVNTYIVFKAACAAGSSESAPIAMSTFTSADAANAYAMQLVSKVPWGPALPFCAKTEAFDEHGLWSCKANLDTQRGAYEFFWVGRRSVYKRDLADAATREFRPIVPPKVYSVIRITHLLAGVGAPGPRESAAAPPADEHRGASEPPEEPDAPNPAVEILATVALRTLANTLAASHFTQALKPARARLSAVLRFESEHAPLVRAKLEETNRLEEEGGGLVDFEMEMGGGEGAARRTVRVFVQGSEVVGPLN